MTILALALCTLPNWACLAQQKTIVSANLVHAVCMVESRGNYAAYSPHDAGSPSIGLCQIKLKTARWLGFQGNEEQLMQPEVNAYYAAKYLQKHLCKYHDLRMAISAYNAGRAVDYNEEYVNKVLTKMGVSYEQN